MAGLLTVVALAAAVAIALAVFGGPLVFAVIPLLLFVLGFGAVQVMQRQQRATQARSFRQEAKAEKTEFTARDRESTVQDDGA